MPIVLDNGNVYSDYEVSMSRKLREICLAVVELERHSKDDNVLYRCHKIREELDYLFCKDFVPEVNPAYDAYNRKEYWKTIDRIKEERELRG